MTPISKNELGTLKAAALAEGFEWGESQEWYEGQLEGECIVVTVPITDPTHKRAVLVVSTHTVQVHDRKYAMGKDGDFGVLFARV